MIIEMSIENFRSIDAEQTIRFHASKCGNSLLQNTVECKDAGFSILKTSGFYGANGSGKSTFVRALVALTYLVDKSYRFADDKSIPPYEPCAFRSDGENGDVRMSIEFDVPSGRGGRQRYLYSLSYNAREVTFERLSCYNGKRESLLFKREAGMTASEMQYGIAMRGGKRKIAFFGNQLYLSVAGQTPDAPEIVRRAATYLRRDIVSGPSPDCYDDDSLLQDDRLDILGKVIGNIDVGVTGIRRERRSVDIPDSQFPKWMPQSLKNRFTEKASTKNLFRHDVRGGRFAEIELDDESDGTRRFFSMLPMIVDALATGGTIVVDELESSMHPMMAEMIVKLFNSDELNHGQAQLIYTTHNINLLSQDILRRDQIWFVEKRDGRSVYYSLDDFDKRSVTPTSPFVRWYLEGRFGALPAIDFAAIVEQIKILQKDVEAGHAKEG